MPEPGGEQRQSFGHYEVESILGRGAMGMVYLARDRRIGRKVALKTVHVNERFDDDSEAREFYLRLQREAELCGSLHHPNIVTLYEPGYENGVIAWMATEYVDGQSLRDLLRKRKPLALDEALRISEDLLRGMAFAHARGIVHRDIKPANILLTSGGDAKIADFGIARPSDSTLTAVGEMLGTPSYMSPEQVKCTTVTERSDLFSLGAVMYEMITGLKAFAGSDVSGILRNVVELTPQTPAALNADVPEELSAFMMRLLEKSPESRHPSSKGALEELRAIRRHFVSTESTIERLMPADAISTLAVPAGQATGGSVTHAEIDDATPAFGGSTQKTLLQRPVHGALFAAIVLAAVAALAGGVIAIRAASDPRPTYQHPRAQLDEFAGKRKAMAEARGLALSGKFEESVAAYDAYLARYPQATGAKEGRTASLRALEAAKAQAAKQRVTVTATRPKDSTKAAPPEEPKKKPRLWRRILGRD